MLDGLIALLGEWITNVINWFLAFIFHLVDYMLYPIEAMIPDLSVNSYYGAFVQYAGWANKWIALDYGFALLGTYVAIYLAVNAVNWILGLIPTIK